MGRLAVFAVLSVSIFIGQTQPPSTTVPTINSGGIVKCFQTDDGKKLWEKNLDIDVQASPGIAGDRLFVLGESGVLAVLRAGREFEELGRSQLPDKFLASPAFAGGHLFLRGATNLFCLGPDVAKMAKQP